MKRSPLPSVEGVAENSNQAKETRRRPNRISQPVNYIRTNSELTGNFHSLSTMSWLVSLFQSKQQNSRRGQALNSTHDAFSLPTSSPVHPGHPDAFNPDTLQTPDTARSYTYPPTSPNGAYGFMPNSYVLPMRFVLVAN